jgi:lipoprotein-anchoring transpeptidase ErfK/SrfK
MRNALLILGLTGLIILQACAPTSPGVAATRSDTFYSSERAQASYEWHPELAPSGPMRIEIYPDSSQLVVYRNNIKIGSSAISAGREGHSTPAGNYPISQKEINYRSNLYGYFESTRTGEVVKTDVSANDPAPPGSVFRGALMPYFQRLTDTGVGMHAGYLPGYNASHGCIRLPFGFAEKLYAATQIGTPVKVIK